MAGWAGFSEEELRKLQNKDPVVPAVSNRGRRPVPTNRSRQQMQRERALQMTIQHDGSGALPPEQQLTKPKVQSPNQTVPKTTKAEEIPQEKSTSASNEPRTPEHGTGPTNDTGPVARELKKPEVELREKTRLQQLQQEQRLMEEKNKRKKAILSKTIAEKSKQTQAEAVKLKRIQKELQALDDMVSNDIGILRGRIEQASWEYSAARKRYEKAEAEFVTAKLDLHKKTEVKEQLTEHLYTIIQQNELRKALKLQELMQQLELQADEEQLELEIQVERLLEAEKEEEEAQVRVTETPSTGAGEGDGPYGVEATPQNAECKDSLRPQVEQDRRDQMCKPQDAAPSHEPNSSEAEAL